MLKYVNTNTTGAEYTVFPIVFNTNVDDDLTTTERDTDKVDQIINSISVQSNTVGESATTSQGITS